MHDTRLKPLSHLNGSDLKGLLSEDRVEAALVLLLRLGIIFRYFRSRPFGDLDSIGADFLVWSTYKRPHLLQVKSTPMGKEYFQAKYGDGIPCLVADSTLNTVELALQILKELDLETTQFRKLIQEMQIT